MENEDLNLDNIESNVEEKLKVKNRFEKLSEKVIETSKERDDALAKIQMETDAKVQLEKERDFYKTFSQISSKHPEAANYQDQILERVNKGYDAEEAALAVLAKEGKLNYQPTPPIQGSKPQAEGGSAATTFPGDKSLQDMSTEEKRNLLLEADKDGSLMSALRGR